MCVTLRKKCAFTVPVPLRVKQGRSDFDARQAPLVASSSFLKLGHVVGCRGQNSFNQVWRFLGDQRGKNEVCIVLKPVSTLINMPAGGSTAASSLYSGIFNKKDDKDETASSSLGAKVEDGSEMQGKGRGSDIDKVSLQTENESASSAKPQGSSVISRIESWHGSTSLRYCYASCGGVACVS